MADTKPTTTQQRHPWKATLRTAVAYAVGAIVTLATIALLAGPIVDEELSGWEVATPLGQTLIVASIVTRIMALPPVDRLLAKIGLGSAPKPEVTPGA